MQLQGASGTGASTGTGGILQLNGQCARVTFVVEATTGTTTGAVSLEEAYWNPAQPAYAGIWSQIQSVSVTTGAQTVVHVQASAWAVRARITTAIGATGTVNVWAWGN
jgi:hypothetical protein